MKTLVFSDTHLSDRFEEKKLAFLASLIERADRVIINGDFWDGHIITFEEFINSPWKKLFSLLKSKQTVYIYGNHDRQEFSDSRVGAFSAIQANSYEYKDKGTSFFFEHGNHTLPSIDETLHLPRLCVKLSTKTYTRLERFITRRIRKTIRFWGRVLNGKLKKRKMNGSFSIYGHTHYAEFDPRNLFANTGFIQHGLAQYVFIENGRASAHEEWYE